MRFPAMLRILKNSRRIMGAASSSPYTPYPYTPVLPPDPAPPDTRRPTVTILVSPSVPYREFDVTFSWSELVIGFTQSDVRIEGIPHTEVAWEEDENQPGKRFVLTVRPIDTHGGDIKFIVRAGKAQDAAGNWNKEAEKTVTVQPDTYTFTHLPAGTPQPTYPYPRGRAVDRIPADQDPPAPPDYAVIVHPPVPMPTTPALAIQGKRSFSDFEKEIAKVVFKESPSFSQDLFNNKLRIQYKLGKVGENRATHFDGLITVYTTHFTLAPAIDGSTNIDSLDVSELNSPGMLQLVWTLAHEMAHWWQKNQNRHDHKWNMKGYREREDEYRFNEAQLVAHKFVDKEAHASAVATAAVIELQLKYRPAGQLINLTHKGQRNKKEVVGSVERYMKIRGMDWQPNNARHTTSPPVGNWITRGEAETLLADFNTVLTEVRTAQPLPEPSE